MNEVEFVILNYKDEIRVVNLTKKIVAMCDSFSVVVVDNESTSESFSRLDAINGEKKCSIIRSEKNLGYTGGHNLAFDYILNCRVKPQYIAVINSDVDFELSLIENGVHYMGKNPNIGLLSARMIENGSEKVCCWHFPTYKQFLGQTFWYIKNAPRIVAPYNIDDSEPLLKVDVIRGSFQLLSYEALNKVRCYDDMCFLYNFENIMSYELMKNGYDVYLMTNCYYLHNHKYGDKNNEWKRIKVMEQDSIHYLQDILNLPNYKVLFYRIISSLNFALLSLKKRIKI